MQKFFILEKTTSLVPKSDIFSQGLRNTNYYFGEAIDLLKKILNAKIKKHQVLIWRTGSESE